MSPLVSVVIPLYNKERYIGEALQSVLSQTVQEFEVVVVNDGSTDGGADIVRQFADSRIRLIEQKNAGAAAARNTGIMAAQGEWIAFLDADDRWLPHNLESHFRQLGQHPDVQWSAGMFNRRSATHVSPMKINSELLAAQSDSTVVRDALLLLPHGFLCTDTVLVRKSVFSEVGGMDQTLRTAEDLDMWLRIALVHPRMAYCAEPIAEYSVEVAGSLTHQQVHDPLNLPHFLFARKHLPDMQHVEPGRREAINRLIRGLLQIGIRRLLLAGCRSETNQILTEFRTVLGDESCAMHHRLAYIPAVLLRAGFGIKQMLKKA
jgi:glycosyltransferase involved in cell wall biosynthesis